jgi:hypothetical protein
LTRMARDRQQESATNAPDSQPVTVFFARSAGCRINYSLTKLADC